MIFLILLLALILRLINLNQSLWLDEATQAILSSKSLYSIWFDRAADFHPPLSYILFHFWLMFGRSEIWLRLLPVIFGVATVAMVFLIAKKLFNEKIALLSAFLLAIGPYHIYYSQEVRMYSLTTFFAAASVYFYLNPLKNKLFNSLGFVLSSTILIYSHYMGFFLLISLIVYSIWKKNGFYKEFLLIGILWLPWFPEFWVQFISGVKADQYLPGWSRVLSLDPIKALPLTFLKFSIGRISFDNHYFYGGLAAFVFIVFGYCLFSLANKIKDEDVQLILFWFCVPLILSLLISFRIPLDQPFRLLFILPAFYILMAVGVDNLKELRKFALGLVIFISLSCLCVYYITPKFWREDWRNATSFVNSKLDANSIVIFTWGEPFSSYLWYNGEKAVGIVNKFPATELEVATNLNLVDVNKVYFFEYLQALSDPNKYTQKVLVNDGFSLSRTNDFKGVGFVDLYVR